MDQTSTDSPLFKVISRKELQHLLASEHGILYINAVVRFLILFALTVFFRRLRPDPLYPAIHDALIIYFFYNLSIFIFGYRRAEWFLLPWVKTFQSLFETALYTLFFVLNNDPQSTLIFLNLVPLYFASRLFTKGRYLAIGFVQLVIVIGSILWVADSIGLSDGAVTVVSRMGGMLLMAGLFMVRHPFSRTDIEADPAPLKKLVESLNDDVFMVNEKKLLVFVSPGLEVRHGALRYPIKPHEYFGCHSSVFVWPKPDTTDNQPRTVQFKNKSNQKYNAKLTISPFLTETKHISGYVGAVHDLKSQMALEQMFEDQIRQLEQKALNNIYYGFGKNLTGIKNSQAVMDYVVAEVQKELSAEHVGLFLIDEQGVLQIHASCGIPIEKLREERYLVGEGISGKVLQPTDGSAFGAAIIVNDVPNDDRKIQEYYRLYCDLLPSKVIQNLLGVPLNGSRNSFGLLQVINRKGPEGEIASEGFSKQDETLLSAIASLAAVSIENTRSLDELNQRMQEIDVLYRTIDRLSHANDYKDLLQKIVKEAHQNLRNANQVTIHLIEEGELVVKAASKQTIRNTHLANMKIDEGIAGKVIANGEHQYCPDTAALASGYVDRGNKDLSSLCVTPLKIDDQVIGILSANSSKVNGFDTKEVNFLDALADHAAVAIQKANSLEEKSKRNQQIEVLNRVSFELNKKLEFSDLLNTVMSLIKEVVPYDSISIQLRKGKTLSIVECKGFLHPAEVRKVGFPLEDPKFPNFDVIKRKKAFIDNDIQKNYPHFVEENQKYHSRLIRSWMGIPLIDRGHAIGMISFDSHQLNFYTPEMRDLARALANVIANAIVKSRRFDEVTQLTEDLKGLQSATSSIKATLSLEQVGRQTAVQAKALMNADHVALVLVNDHRRFPNSYETDIYGKPFHKVIRIGKGVTESVLTKKTPRVIDALPADSKSHNPWIQQHGFKSYVVHPVMNREEKVLAVLYLHSKQENSFKEKRNLIGVFCSHVALALENADQVRKLEDQSQKISIQNQILGRQVDAGVELMKLVEVRDVLRFTVQKVPQIFGVNGCSLYLTRDADNCLTLAETNNPEATTPCSPIPLDAPSSLSEVVLRNTGRPLCLTCEEFYRREYQFNPTFDHLPSGPRRGCNVMLMPLLDSQHVCQGVLIMQGVKPKSDLEEVGNIFATFASQVSLAIERARFHEQLNDRARKEAREMLARDLHELEGNVLGTIKTRLEVARQQFQHKEYSDLEEELNRLNQSTDFVHLAINRIHNDLNDRTVKTLPGIRDSLKVHANLSRIPADFEFENYEALSPKIANGFYRIGIEALNNVARHTNCASTVVRFVTEGNRYRFQIEDDGCGFDIEAKMTRGESDGIHSMQHWAEEIEGKLHIYPSESGGTIVEVTGYLQKEETDGR